MSLSPGTKLGRYEIRSKLGEGGKGQGPRFQRATKEVRDDKVTETKNETLPPM